MSDTASEPDKRASIFASQTAAEAAWESFKTAVFMLDMFDWGEVGRAINHAHSVGHIIDPTGYRGLIHNRQVEINTQLAAASHKFLCEVRDIQAKASAVK